MTTGIAAEAGPDASKALGMTHVESAMRRRMALLIMLVPALGTLEALRLAIAGAAGWVEWSLFACMYFAHMGGVTMGFHRLLAHRAFFTSDALRALLVVLGSMAGQGPVIYWVATHRAHHAYSDTPADPHSPQLFGRGWRAQLRGLWYAHMPWMLAPRIASSAHFARDLLRQRGLMRLNASYFVWLVLGLILPAAAGGLARHGWAGAWSGFIFGGLARMFVANQAAWCVGSVCHMFGARRFRTHDASANSWWVAILTFGEGLQNNHHAFPSSYRHAMRWWEPDLSGWCIALLARLGLVDNLRPPSPAAIQRTLLLPDRNHRNQKERLSDK